MRTKKYLYGIVLTAAVVLAAGCSAKKKLAEDRKERTPEAVESASALLAGIEAALPVPSMAEYRVDMTLGGRSVGGTMRLAPGERLWLNVSALGITFARGMFTQDSLMYYERLKKTAFSGSWDEIRAISPVLGAVNYDVLEALVCARPLFRLSEEDYAGDSGDFYAFARKEPQSGLEMNIAVDKTTLKIAWQRISSPDGEVGLSGEYTYVPSGDFPQSVLFTVFSPGGEKAVKLDFSPARAVEGGFPFRLPQGYSDARDLLRALGVEI